MCRLNRDPCLLASLPDALQGVGAERADRIRTRGNSTQPQQYRRTRYFGRNELSRLCLAVLELRQGQGGQRLERRRAHSAFYLWQTLSIAMQELPHGLPLAQ